jgi:hypothetical protein
MFAENTTNLPAAKIKIPVKSARALEQIVELELGRRVTAILGIVAAERGWKVEELILVRDGEDEPLTDVVLVDEHYPHKQRHHVHRVGEISVTVYYQSGQHVRHFRRHTTVGDVLSWAVVAFKVDPNIAIEFELARHGIKEELPKTEHIGHVAEERCELALDLVRGDIANGRGL